MHGLLVMTAMYKLLFVSLSINEHEDDDDDDDDDDDNVRTHTCGIHVVHMW